MSPNPRSRPSASRHAVKNSATLRLDVKDSGIGIATATQAHLFKPFTQADGSLTRKNGGTGLGLAIVKRLAEMMGGAVGVESKDGQGANFWCTIRLKTCMGGIREKPALPWSA